MSIRFLTQKYFYGGIASSKKIGVRGSFALAQRANIFDEATEVTINPTSVKVSGTTVTDLIKWIVSGNPYDTNTYFYSSGGKLYKETSGGTWSTVGTLSTASGQGADLYSDYIYFTKNAAMARYGPLSGSPSLTDPWATATGINTTSDYAPVKAFLNGLAVGHGNYLGWWDGSVWDNDRLILAPGYKIRSLEVIDEFLVIGCWRGTSITANEQGRLYFWDGTSQNYNYMVEINEGGVAAVLNNKNRLITSIGGSGVLMQNYRPFQKINTVPLLTIGKYVEVLPGAMTNWRGMAHIGIGGNTDSADIYQGVYTFGNSREEFPEALNYGYTISTGTAQSTTLKIGALKGIGNNLYIAWRDGDTYGVDKVTNSGSPFASAVIESLIFDNDDSGRDKLALKLKATHLPLASGESVQLGYKVNRASSYTTGTANSTVDSAETELPIPATAARFTEFQWESILAATGSTSPTLTSVTLQFDDLAKEEAF